MGSFSTLTPFDLQFFGPPVVITLLILGYRFIFGSFSFPIAIICVSIPGIVVMLNLVVGALRHVINESAAMPVLYTISLTTFEFWPLIIISLLNIKHFRQNVSVNVLWKFTQIFTVAATYSIAWLIITAVYQDGRR
jgi:hypothetical protein